MVSADNKWLLLAERIVDEWAEITFPRPAVALDGYEQSDGCYWCGGGEESTMPCSCGNRRMAWLRTFRLGEYDSPLAECICRGKYSAWLMMLEYLGLELGERIRGCVPPNSILVPIPMPLIRRYFRRVDHTGVLTKYVSQASGIPIRRALWRKESAPQAGMTAAQRQKMRRNCMLLRPFPRIKGKNAILIDDVLTTGTTLEVAANKLKMGGVASVRVGVLAVTKRPKKGKIL